MNRSSPVIITCPTSNCGAIFYTRNRRPRCPKCGEALVVETRRGNPQQEIIVRLRKERKKKRKDK